MTAVIITLVWLAAAIRISVSVRRGAEVWRTAFTVGVVAVAAGITVYFHKPQVDQILATWNVGDLLGHILLVVAGGAAQVYLLHLRSLHSSIRATIVWCTVTAAAVAWLVVAWSLAPLHDAPHEDLMPLAADPWVVAYYVGFWTFMAWCEVCTAFWCLKHGVRLRAHDVSQPLGLLLIGMAALAGVVLSAIYSSAMLVVHLNRTPVPALTRFGDLLLPVAPVLLALAILCLAILPRVDTLVTARLRWRWLGPLWADLIHRYPEVHLPMTPPRSPIAKVQVRETRAVVEIHDALSLATVAVPPTATLQQLAVALRNQQGGARLASDLLPPAASPQEGTLQLVELAKEYARAA